MEAPVSTTNAPLLLRNYANVLHSEEEDPDEYPFPLTLRTKTAGATVSPPGSLAANGN
jgi:hypothetical protein